MIRRLYKIEGRISGRERIRRNRGKDIRKGEDQEIIHNRGQDIGRERIRRLYRIKDKISGKEKIRRIYVK